MMRSAYDITSQVDALSRLPVGSKLPSFERGRTFNKTSSHMFGSTAKAISHYKDKQILLNTEIGL
ncbi:MAG: hypothetical protein IJD53_06025 [Alistipes sp.]|nr:hypothetical protein [Alistipes sp.]